MKKKISRRKFVKNSVMGLGGAGLISSQPLFSQDNKTEKKTEQPGKSAKIKKYHKLGKTGFKVSDISLGACHNEAVIKMVLDAGVNYIDTAEQYRNQTIVGKAIKGRDRKSIFITSKLLLEKKTGFTKEGIIKRFNKCLEELQTEYIDCMMVHSPETVDIMLTPGFHQAMDQMKKEGKLKFVGVSNHGSNHALVTKESMEKILTAAAMDGRFNVFLMAYNFVQADNGKKVLEICNKKGIGTTIMKKNPVGLFHAFKGAVERIKKAGKTPPKVYVDSLGRLKKKADMAEAFIKKYKLENEKEISDAAIRFVLNDDNVDSVVCSIRNFDLIDRYVSLSGTNLTVYDQQKLTAFKEGCAQLYCRHACGECESDCPKGVPVNTIMRYFHYMAAQGREEHALKKYLHLDRPKPDQCMNCEGFCEKSCRYGVPIQGMLLTAHERLTLA